MAPVVGILVDYESPLAREVAATVWGGLSSAALRAGYTRTTALWESLQAPGSEKKLERSVIYIFAVGQDRPDAVDAIRPVGVGDASHLYGVVVALPERASPLAGSLLYQGLGQLTEGGIRAGAIEPALLRALPKECESYAKRLLERLSPLLEA